MEFIYKRVTFQLGDVLNKDSFYPNSYLREKGIKPLEEDETEEDIKRKKLLLEKQEEERLRKLQLEQDELDEEELRKKLQEQKQLEENERIQKEQVEKNKYAQKGILKKQKAVNKQPIQLDEYGKPIKNEHPLHKLKIFNKWEKLYRVGPGLTNFGNTCFINSVLQVVTYTPPLVNYFTQKKHSAVCKVNSQKRKQLADSSLFSNSSRSSTLYNQNSFCLMCFLENHMRKCFTATVNIIHPVIIVHNMNKLISDFKIGKQEDPLTFFTIIVSQIKKEPFQPEKDGQEEGDSQNGKINERSDKEKQVEMIKQKEQETNKQNEQEEDSDSELSQSRKEEEQQYIDTLNQKNVDLFNNMFTGAIQYNISCYSCKTEQIQYEIFYTLVLDIKGMDSLDDCLSAKFAEKEVVCKQCKYSKAIRTANIYNFPNIMVIKINRFYEIMKIQKNIDYKTDLNLQEYSISKQYSPQNSYFLYAMITHQGSVAWGGHYYSYIKDSSENWYCMNDSSVRQVTINEMRNDPPYLLFYIKQEPSHQMAIPQDLVKKKDQLKELSRSLSQKRNMNIQSKKKIEITPTPENFYNVQESQVLSTRNGSNIFVKRSNNPSPVQKTPNGIQINPLREPSKSPQHNRLKSSLGIIGAYSPIRSRASSINEDAPLSQQPYQTKNQQKKQLIKRTFITPQRNREPSYELKKITQEDKSYYLIPISDEKQRQSYSIQGDYQKIFKRKQKQQNPQGINLSTTNPITNEDKAFQQNFEFEKSRVVKMPKIKKSNGDQSDYLKLSELSMLSPNKFNSPFSTVKNSDKKRIFIEQNSNSSTQRSQNQNDKQFHFYEDYEKRFSSQGFAQQVYNISYVSGGSTKQTDIIPFISPKKPKYSISLPQNNDESINFGYINENPKPYKTFNMKRTKQNSQDENNQEFQANISAISCTEPYRSNKEKSPSNHQNTLELTNQFDLQSTSKAKTQTSNFTNKQISEKQNSLTNPNKTTPKKRKSRKRASSFDHLRTLLNNSEQRNQSLPEKLFYKNTNILNKKRKKNLKSARSQKPEWQF